MSVSRSSHACVFFVSRVALANCMGGAFEGHEIEILAASIKDSLEIQWTVELLHSGYLRDKAKCPV